MEEEQCQNYRYWAMINKHAGFCRRSAPRIVMGLLQHYEQLQVEQLDAVWPITYAKEYCGDWEAPDGAIE